MTVINSNKNSVPIDPNSAANAPRLSRLEQRPDLLSQKISDLCKTLREACLQGWARLLQIRSTNLSVIRAKDMVPGFPTIDCMQGALNDIDIAGNQKDKCVHLHLIKSVDHDRWANLSGTKLPYEAKRVYQYGVGASGNSTIARQSMANQLFGFDHLMQFVSPERFQDQRRMKETVIGIFKDWAAKSPDGLSPEYQIANINKVLESGQCKTYEVVFKADEYGNQMPSKRISVAGFAMENKVLKAEHIVQSFDALTAGMDQGLPEQDIMFLSKSGVGRSAALMTVYEIVRRHQQEPFKSVEDIQNEIDQVIQDGRRNRGPHFIPNRGQYDAVVSAALTLIQRDLIQRDLPASKELPASK